MPNATNKLDTVNIKPGVGILSMLRLVEYQPWFALAEFVDNSLQSFLDHREKLRNLNGQKFLTVEIELDTSDGVQLVIRDDAAGIGKSDYARAFRPAELPPDRTGLSEFGMGMKSAACWFAPVWQVRTTALGEDVERQITFKLEKIVKDEIEELEIIEKPAPRDSHFTEVRLLELDKKFHGRTLGKIKEHLGEIYRVFIREKSLVLKFGKDVLSYNEPAILVAPMYNDKNEPIGDDIKWKIDLNNFDFGNGLRVSGFVALRKDGSTKFAGFSLFRRKRLIKGSGDEKFRPHIIFGSLTTYAYQRIFGELHLEGFDVSYKKDGFLWDENGEPLFELLKDELNKPDKPLLNQAKNFRIRAAKKDLKKAANKASKRTGDSLEQHGPKAMAEAADEPIEVTTPKKLAEAKLASRREVDIEFEERRWRIVLELSTNTADDDWLKLSDAVLAGTTEVKDRELLGLRLSLTHPFMEKFAEADDEKIEPLLRVAVALGLAEKLARDAGVKHAGAIRTKLNKILKRALARL